MRLIALALVTAAASCGSNLTPSATPDADPPEQPDAGPAALSNADCTIFNPTACRIDLPKTAVAIDVNYPNVVFCGLQILPTRDLSNTAVYKQLASAWDVTLGSTASDQTILTAETPHAVLEYPLGTQQLYLGRVTFASKSADTIATLVENALGADVSLYAVPLSCPGH